MPDARRLRQREAEPVRDEAKANRLFKLGDAEIQEAVYRLLEGDAKVKLAAYHYSQRNTEATDKNLNDQRDYLNIDDVVLYRWQQAGAAVVTPRYGDSAAMIPRIFLSMCLYRSAKMDRAFVL